MKLTIKRVSGMDIGAIRQMSVDFFKELDVKYPHMDDNEIDAHMMEILSLKDDPNVSYLIAYDGKKPAGFYLGYTADKPYSRPRRVAVAQELYVVPEKRSRLVGLRLMEEAGKLAIQQGAEGFECMAGFGTTDKKWEKFGFKPFITYGYMEPQAFMEIVQRFTQGKKPAKEAA